jgi:hypothetical protein
MSLSKDNRPDRWTDAVRLSDDIYYSLREGRNPTVWHWCVTHDRWMGQGTDAHTVNSLEPLDMSPSLEWTCCGIHGHIRNGKWVSV